MFEVWAPAAQRIDLVVGDGSIRLPMAPGVPDRPGWWWVEADGTAAGTDYAFSVDGGPARPDPRSAWQPHGVDGPSRVVDHDAFAWNDSVWRGFHLPAAVLYELHVGTFTAEGTFAAAAAPEKLGHLVELGVTAVEVMPIAAFVGQRGWGYDGVALYAVHEPYGGPDGFKHFVDACHAVGLGVVLDVVYNHLGPSGNHLAEFGPYFTDRYQTPWGPAVNFDGRASDEVRAFAIDNALTWLRDYHVDGLRLDAVDAIVDESATHIVEELAVEVERLAAHLGRPLWVIAESDENDPRLVRSRDAHGFGVHAQWSDNFHHALHVALTGEYDGYYQDFSAESIKTALERGYVQAGSYSLYRGRVHGRPLDDVPFWRLIGYAQNHDQVGNRARGERLSELVSVEFCKVAAALVLTSPFVPLVFQGEEWAAGTPFRYFCDYQEPAMIDAVRRGRAEEFGAFGWDAGGVPDPNDPETFVTSKLDWSERERTPHRDVLAWYRALIALRRERPELTDGEPAEVLGHWEKGVFEVFRGSLSMAVNLSSEAFGLRGMPGALLLASDDECELTEDGLELPAQSVAIVDLDA